MHLVIARNISNANVFSDFVKEISTRTTRTEVKSWLKKQLKKYVYNDYAGVSKVTHYKKHDPDWLKKAVDSGDDIFSIEITSEFRNQVLHIIDFFNAIKEDSLKKLPKLTFDVALKKADAWTAQMIKKSEKNKKKAKILKEEGADVIHIFDDGFSWKRLTTEEALNREGELMGHCVGSYFDKVAGNDVEIYSLRDPDNEPHCTIEYDKEHSSIEQIKGKGNQEVVEKYVPYVKTFLRENPANLEITFVEDLDYIGGISVGSSFIFKDELPEDLDHSDEDYYHRGRYNEITLEEGSIVKNVSWDETEQRVSENLKVVERIKVSDCDASVLPEKISATTILLKNIKGKLEIKPGWDCHTLIIDTSVPVSIPDNFKVARAQLDNVVKIGKNVSIKHLELNNSPLKSLPKTIKVSMLDLRTLPNLKTIPTHLFKINLDIEECPNISLPKKLKGDFTFEGDVNIQDGTVITGDLDLVGNNKPLGKNITVTGSIWLKECKLLKGGNGLESPRIRIIDCEISKLPPKLKCDRLNLEGLNSIKIPKTLGVTTELSISKCKGIVIPSGFKKNIVIKASSLAEIGDDVTVKSLIVNSAKKTKVGKRLTVKEKLALRKLSLKKLPVKLSVGKELDISGSTQITTLPTTLKHCRLRVKNTGIKALPLAFKDSKIDIPIVFGKGKHPVIRQLLKYPVKRVTVDYKKKTPDENLLFLYAALKIMKNKKSALFETVAKQLGWNETRMQRVGNWLYKRKFIDVAHSKRYKGDFKIRTYGGHRWNAFTIKEENLPYPNPFKKKKANASIEYQLVEAVVNMDSIYQSEE